MIAICDYGVGNLFSLTASLNEIEAENEITAKESDFDNASAIILPGVGAFGDAYAKLKSSGLIPVIKREIRKGKPLLGICLGMQLLFDKSYEFGEHEGLKLIDGEVRGLGEVLNDGYKIPHMGWNSLDFKKPSALFKYINEGDYVYFVHSFHAVKCEKNVTSTAFYGVDVTASVENGNVFGTQFHPEKSGDTGLKILKAFTEIK